MFALLLLFAPVAARAQITVEPSATVLWLRASDNLMSAEGTERAMVGSSVFAGPALSGSWGPVLLRLGYLRTLGDRQVVSFLPPFSTAPYATVWQSGFVTGGVALGGGVSFAPDWEITGTAGLSYWANVLYRDEESEQTRASLSEEERATLDELFVSVSAGVRHAVNRRWSWEVTLNSGYNLLAGEAVWQQMADASPELHYWPVGVYIGLNAGVRFRL